MNKKSAKQLNQSLKDSLLERIEEENVCPRSRLFFRSRECSVWFLWFLSVLIGALSFAVLMFVVQHSQYALYEATHENFFTFMVEALPFLWIIVFGIMAFVAIYNLRHTKHGYRYPLWMILASSVVLSFAGGSAFHLFGFGHEIDEILGKSMPIYMSQEKQDMKMWQAPSEGRLLGRQVFTTVSPTTSIIFEDIEGIRWNMRVVELPMSDIEALGSGKLVKLLGKSTNDELRIFHACGAFPWMYRQGSITEHMIEEREMFEERVHEHARKADAMRALQQERATSSSPESVCATIAAVKRMPVKNQKREGQSDKNSQ